MGLFTFFFPFPSPPSCSRELVLVNVEDHNMITPSLMKLNHFSSKRKGWGDRLAGRPARDERILKAGWQPRSSVPSGGGQGGGSRAGAPALQMVAVAVALAVARRSQVSHLCPRHLSHKCKEWWWELVKVCVCGGVQRAEPEGESSGKKLNP